MVEIFGVALQHRHQRFHDLLNGLMKFWFAGILRNDSAHELLSKKLLDWTHWAFLLRFGISIDGWSNFRERS